jgi:hypothetical protein
MKRAWKAIKATDGVMIVATFAILSMLAVAVPAACTQQQAAKTALDVGSCAVDAVANAAAPILGQVSGIILSPQSDAQAQAQIEALAISAGAAAVLCAIDRVIADLGAPKTGSEPMETAVITTARVRANTLRTVVLAKLK